MFPYISHVLYTVLHSYSFYRIATSASNSDITTATGMAMIREAPPPTVGVVPTVGTVISHTGATHPEGKNADNWAVPSGPRINSMIIDRLSKQHDICIRKMQIIYLHQNQDYMHAKYILMLRTFCTAELHVESEQLVFRHGTAMAWAIIGKNVA